MGFTENVKIVIDVVADKSASSLGNLKSKIADAEGGFGKLKAAGGGAFDLIGAAGPAALAGVGAAVGAFAVKSIGAFQETALAAGKFADSAGLTVETASKYIAVADDLGIGADTIQNAFIKMEKQIGSNRQAFEGLIGADPSQTFQNVITHLQGISDPMQRATESSRLFGKGFAEVSELINTDAGQIADALGKVSDAQIITQDELAKARDYRAAMDNLKDSVGDVQREVGEQLVPALADLANFAAKTITVTVDFAVKGADVFEKANKQAGGWLGPIVDAAKSAVNPVGESLNTITGAYNTFLDATKQAGLGASTLGQGFDAMKTKAQQMGTAIGPAGAAIGDLARAQTEGNVAAHLLADDGSNRLAAAFKNVEDAANKANDAIRANSDAQLAAFDATFAVKDAQDQFATSLLAATTAEQDSTKSSGEKQQAYDDETKAAEGVAIAIQKKAEQDAIASGTALTAAQSNDVLIGALYDLAKQTTGPTHDALVGLIGKLQETGQQHPEPTVTLNDLATAPLSDVHAQLKAIDGATATARVSANTSSANSALDMLSQRLQQAANTSVTVGTGRTVRFAHGGLVDAPKGQAVPATVHGGEYVLSEDVVSRIKQGRPSQGASGASVGSGGGVTVNLNGTFLGADKASIGRWIDEALAASRRRGNRAG